MRYSIIHGTNRDASLSLFVARYVEGVFQQKGILPEFYSLQQLPSDFLNSEMFGSRSEAFETVVQTKIASADKFVFIVPEYNGGFPGVLKTFIDAVHPKHFESKKAGMIGVSAGHAGSARAMDQLTNVLNYLKVNVMYQKPKLSGIEHLLNDGKLIDKRAMYQINAFADELEKF